MFTPFLVGKSTINGHVQLTVLVYQRVNMIVAELAAELLDGWSTVVKNGLWNDPTGGQAVGNIINIHQSQ